MRLLGFILANPKLPISNVQSVYTKACDTKYINFMFYYAIELIEVTTCKADGCDKPAYYEERQFDYCSPGQFDYCSPECRDDHLLDIHKSQLESDIQELERILSLQGML